MPYLDAGVEVDGSLVRVSMYVPRLDAACLECGWDQTDYETLEQAYPCCSDWPEAAPTNAASALGAMAVALQIMECKRLLAGQQASLPCGGEILADLDHHKLLLTEYRRNEACQFDHNTWPIELLPRSAHDMVVANVFDLARRNRCAAPPIGFRVADNPFVRRLSCPNCGRQTEVGLLLYGRGHSATCDTCGRRMRATAFDVHEWLEEGSLGRDDPGRSLASLGCRRGDVLMVGGLSRLSYFEISGFDEGE